MSVCVCVCVWVLSLFPRAVIIDLQTSLLQTTFCSLLGLMPASWYSSYPPLLLDLSWLFLSLLTSLVSPRSTPRPEHTWTLFPDMVAGWDLSLLWLSQSLAGVMKAAGGLSAYPCCASSFLPQPKVFLIRTLTWPGRLCSSWIISVAGSNGMCVCVAGRGPFLSTLVPLGSPLVATRRLCLPSLLGDTHSCRARHMNEGAKPCEWKHLHRDCNGFPFLKVCCLSNTPI